MSTALAVAGVTAVLRALLDAWLVDQDANAALGGANAEVSAVAPDLIELSGANAGPRLNLFLHQINLNQGWRNVGLPSVTADGRRSSSPPLALDLHYLLTAYGPQTLQAEVLLGYGMQLLHSSPVLMRQAIDDLLPPPLVSSGLGSQVEQLRITPEPMGVEETSKLWSALQAKYRPSVGYQVTVLLIEAVERGRAAPPVLTRGPVDPVTGREQGVAVLSNLGPTVPGITAVRIPDSQPGATVGQTVDVEGHALDGATRSIVLENRQYGNREETNSLPGSGAELVRFTVPASVTVGTYALSVRIADAGGSERTTNQLTLTVVPQITTPFPIMVAVDPQGDARVALTCVPEVGPSQQVSLILGEHTIPADPHPAATSSLAFTIPDAVPGNHLAWVRVDGIDSVIVDRTAVPPVFLDQWVTIS